VHIIQRCHDAWGAGSVGDSEGSALRRALACAGLACLESSGSIGLKGRRGRAAPQSRRPGRAHHV